MRALLLAALCLAGCENDLDETPNQLRLPDAAQPEAGLDGGTNECPAVGDWYVFDTLSVASIAGDPNHGSISNLNTIWAGDIEKKQLNVLFEVTSADATHIAVRAINAARLDDDKDDWCLVPETSVDIRFDRDGSSLTMSEEAGINIYAGSESIPKICSPNGDPRHTIPIREALLEATLGPGCGSFQGGKTVKAVIFGTALRSVCSCLSPGSDAEQCGAVDPDHTDNFGCDGCNNFHRNLHQLLEAFTQPDDDGVKRLYEVADDGTERLLLDAEFSAVRIDTAPAVCP